MSGMVSQDGQLKTKNKEEGQGVKRYVKRIER